MLLVYGGSQGSKAINDVVAHGSQRGCRKPLRYLGDGAGHLRRDYSQPRERRRLQRSAIPVADSEAYAAADFALARGGAMATAELCAWGIPPIVVPLPTAAADHQTANAKGCRAAGAAEMILQSDLSPEAHGSVGSLRCWTIHRVWPTLQRPSERERGRTRHAILQVIYSSSSSETDFD